MDAPNDVSTTQSSFFYSMPLRSILNVASPTFTVVLGGLGAWDLQKRRTFSAQQLSLETLKGVVPSEIELPGADGADESSSTSSPLTLETCITIWNSDLQQVTRTTSLTVEMQPMLTAITDALTPLHPETLIASRKERLHGLLRQGLDEDCGLPKTLKGWLGNLNRNLGNESGVLVISQVLEVLMLSRLKELPTLGEGESYKERLGPYVKKMMSIRKSFEQIGVTLNEDTLKHIEVLSKALQQEDDDVDQEEVGTSYAWLNKNYAKRFKSLFSPDGNATWHAYLVSRSLPKWATWADAVKTCVAEIPVLSTEEMALVTELNGKIGETQSWMNGKTSELTVTKRTLPSPTRIGLEFLGAGLSAAVGLYTNLNQPASLTT